MRDYLDDENVDPLLPSQYFDQLRLREPTTPDSKIAWRKLHRDLCDVVFGPAKQRINYIDKILKWVFDENAPYPFDFWVSQLDPKFDLDYFREGFVAFLRSQREDAINDTHGLKSKNETAERWAILRGKGSVITRPHPSKSHLPIIFGQMFVCSRCGEMVDEINELEEIKCELPS